MADEIWNVAVSWRKKPKTFSGFPFSFPFLSPLISFILTFYFLNFFLGVGGRGVGDWGNWEGCRVGWLEDRVSFLSNTRPRGQEIGASFEGEMIWWRREIPQVEMRVTMTNIDDRWRPTNRWSLVVFQHFPLCNKKRRLSDRLVAFYMLFIGRSRAADFSYSVRSVFYLLLSQYG